MTRSLLLAATALALSAAVALAQNGPVTPGYSNDAARAPAKSQHMARHQKATSAPLYDYAPMSMPSHPTMPLTLGVAF